jgi:membrane protease YdiL (CAAX protease family)
LVENGSELGLWPQTGGRTPAPTRPRGLVDSPLIAQADAARRPTRGLAAAAIGLILPFAFVGAGAAASQALRLSDPAAATLLVSLLALGPLVVAAWVMMQLVEGRPARAERPPLLPSIAVGTLIGAAGFGLAIVLAAWGPGASLKAAGMTPLSFLIALALILLQATGEEVFFRGWLLPILTSRWGAWVGLIATSLLFAAPHYVGSPLTPLAVLNDTLAGVVFGVLALRTGGLAAPIAAHFAWNFTEAHVLGAYPNPGIDPLGALFDLEFSGPGWRTGGEAALNGALPATLALGLMAIAAYALSPRPR